MFDKNDSAVYPDAEQMSSYIHNHLWTDFCDYMKEVYQSEPSF